MQSSSSAQPESSSESHDSKGNGQPAKAAPRSRNRDTTPGAAALQAVRMLRGLCREVVQSETAVRLHCRREAERLTELPPAVPLRACAEHAEKALKSMPGQGAPEQLPMSVVGTLSGTVVSTMQSAVVYRLISSERAYRTTLLTLREGIDLVRLLRELARLLQEQALVAWCGDWLKARTPLVVDAEDALEWFAQHADEAMQTARPIKLGRRA
jgi:hypothetical protein